MSISQTQSSAYDPASVAGHVALCSLLLASLNLVSEAFKARLEAPRAQITA